MFRVMARRSSDRWAPRTRSDESWCHAYIYVGYHARASGRPFGRLARGCRQNPAATVFGGTRVGSVHTLHHGIFDIENGLRTPNRMQDKAIWQQFFAVSRFCDSGSVNNVFRRYVLEDFRLVHARNRQNVPRFLLNDTVRYWRTMGVDFAYS